MTPRDLLVEAVRIDDEHLLDLSLGRPIYSKEQLDKFLKFQDSQGTRRSYLTETAELVYGGHSKEGVLGRLRRRPSSTQWGGPWYISISWLVPFQ